MGTDARGKLGHALAVRAAVRAALGDRDAARADAAEAKEAASTDTHAAEALALYAALTS